MTRRPGKPPAASPSSATRASPRPRLAVSEASAGSAGAWYAPTVRPSAPRGCPWHRTNPCPVFDTAYLAYECRLARPGRDRDGRRLLDTPWVDIGSHRLYFLEITAIQLRADVARGE